MWDNFQPKHNLLTLQKILLEQLEEQWPRKKHISVLSPRQEMINSSLIYFAIKHKTPTLILCNSVERYREWQNAIIKFSDAEDIDKNFTTLTSLQNKTPFIITHYGHFCDTSHITKRQKKIARTIWEYEQASLGAQEKLQKNIGDLDAIHEAQKQLDDFRKHDRSTYDNQILRFIDLEKDKQTFDDKWLTEDFDSTVDLLASLDVGLILCDDSHEVSGLWAEALNKLLLKLHKVKLLSTTPLDISLLALSPRDLQLQKLMFDIHPIQLKLSTMVRDNCFKPYRGLFKICRPTTKDLSFLHKLSDKLHTVFKQVEDKNLVKSTLTDFALKELSTIERDIPGQWAHRYEYVQSVLNFLVDKGTNFPITWDLFLDKIEEVSFQKNMPLIKEYIFRVLKSSTIPRELEYADNFIEALKPLGFTVGEYQTIEDRSIIPNIITHSESKEISLVETLEHEYKSLQKNLRAVIICDFLEHTIASKMFKDVQFSSSCCGMLSIFNKIRNSSVADNINPIIIYENRIMFSSYLKVILQREIKEHLENQAGTPYFIYSENNEFSTITISHMGSFKKMWLPLLTKLLENKIVHCLIVGREFLTHRWDGICFNTFLNISAAESTLFSTRLLARILEPGFDIVAAKHLWDFCCIMPETEYGMSDYARIATRKAYGWHLCEDGEFEQGINYFHPFLRKGMSNIPQSLMQEVNDTATRLITHRDNILEMWSTKHSRDNHGRDVLEISMPRSIDLQKPLVVERESEEKLTHNTISLFNLIHDMCSVVIKCIVKSSPLEKSPELILNERHKGVFRLEIKHDSQEVRDSTLKAISELLAPIHHQHHIVSLYFGDEGHHGFFSKFFSQTHLDYCTPFAVPECFFKKNDLAIFLYYWRHDVSKGELLAHRNPRIREDIHHMLNTQQRLIRPNCQTCSLLV